MKKILFFAYVLLALRLNAQLAAPVVYPIAPVPVIGAPVPAPIVALSNTKTGVSKIQDNRIMFLNAYNFDFGSTSVSSNYVAHLNIFAPSLTQIATTDANNITMKKKRFGWGFNTGILKINYNQKDSSNMYRSFKENVL